MNFKKRNSLKKLIAKGENGNIIVLTNGKHARVGRIENNNVKVIGEGNLFQKVEGTINLDQFLNSGNNYTLCVDGNLIPEGIEDYEGLKSHLEVIQKVGYSANNPNFNYFKAVSGVISWLNEEINKTSLAGDIKSRIKNEAYLTVLEKLERVLT